MWSGKSLAVVLGSLVVMIMVLLLELQLLLFSISPISSCLDNIPMSNDELSFSKGVVLKGLPFNVSEDEVKAFFKTIRLSSESIRLIKFRDGKLTGVGFVKLKDDEMERALLMDKNHIGERYIEVIPSDETEMHHLCFKARSGDTDAKDINRMAGRDAKRGIVKRDRSPIRRHLQTRFLYIEGIPPNHQYKEVRRFFKGILIGMNCIHLMKMKECRDFRGDGYIEFKDPTECRKALLLDGQLLDGSVIKLEPCTQDELEYAIRSMESDDKRMRSPSPRRHGRRGGEEEGFFTPAYREREGRYRNTVATMAYGGRGVVDRPKGGYFEEPIDAPPFDSSLYPRNLPGHGNVGADMSFRSRSGIPLVTNHGHSEHKYSPLLQVGMGARGLLGAAATKPLMSLSPSPRVERKIVRLEGLPYDASLQDVVEFFRGYNVNADSVRIQCRDDGSPSGKAFVTLVNDKLAQNAVQELNKRYIRGRYVDMCIV